MCILLLMTCGAWAQESAFEKELVIADFESVEDWPGLQLDSEIVKVGDGSGKWSQMDERAGITCEAIPHDWSEYNALSLWVHNEKKLERTRFMMIIPSEREETEGGDYYSVRFDLSKWVGWKQFIMPFRELGQARQPIGWHKIDRITFTASGWGNTPNPEAVVHFDDLKLLKLARVEGPRLTDEELFGAMNLEYPGMERVKAAVAKGNLGEAKAAWLDRLRTREMPKWYVDWRDRPGKGQAPPAGGSDGWDYYQYQPAVDWTGWKRFELKKSDFGEARKPIGWHWISYIAINASGWGQTPDPETVLYFDDIRLVGKDNSASLGDFEAGPDKWAGLIVSDEQAKVGQHSGKWHNMHVTRSIRLSELPTDWTEFDTLQFWCYSPKATGAKVTMVLNSDESTFAKADQIIEHIIQGHEFGPDIDWSADPTHYREWTYAINRFYHWRMLCNAYWESGLEKYAKEFCDQLVDWVRKNPVPLFTSGNGSYTWRTIECGIRQSTTWPDCLYRVLGSDSFTPEVAATMTKSMVEHAQHLMAWPMGGNWLTMESNGLGTIGILLPEFKEAQEWRDTAMARMYAELDIQVYPDGAQFELTTGYHQVSLNNFLGIARTAKLNEIPIPEDYYAKLRRMFEYNLFVQMPNARTPGLNDGGMGSVLDSMATAYELYEDPVFEWAATRGALGTPPDHTSHFFPYAGQMAMRSSWEPDAHYLLMDAGPYGSGHQHEDNLSIVVYALGKLHIIDPGNYRYDSSPWRRYTIDTPAHNTIMVDGLPQRRRGLRSEYVVKEPIATNTWLTSEKLDYGSGLYDKGYGPKRDVKVAHRREIVFVKPSYWLVVDTLSRLEAAPTAVAGEGEHAYESLFHFDADEAEIDTDGVTVRTIDPTPNCLIAAAKQPGLEVRIVKGQTEPTIQGFVAGQKWRPSWKDPDAEPPEHGKREVPTAIFTLRAAAPARMIYVIYPYPREEKPEVKVEDITSPDGPVQVKVTSPDGIVDEITVKDGAKVVRNGQVWEDLSNNE